jgi:hypothetical protein
MNLCTPKWTSTLGIGVPMDSLIFIEQFQESKPIGLWGSLYHGKILQCRWPIWVIKTQVMAKRRGQESIWFPTTKSWKLPYFLACRWCMTYRWKNLDEGYNFALDLTSIRGLHTKLRASKVGRVPILGISRLPLESLGTKWHLGAGPMDKHKVYYKGEGGGFPEVWVVVSIVSPCLLVARLCTKSALIIH